MLWSAGTSCTAVMIHFPVNITQHPSSQAIALTHKHFNQRGANCKPVPAGGNVHYYHYPAASGSIQPICTLPPGACRSMLQASSHRVMITGCNSTWWRNSMHEFPQISMPEMYPYDRWKDKNTALCSRTLHGLLEGLIRPKGMPNETTIKRVPKPQSGNTLTGIPSSKELILWYHP